MNRTHIAIAALILLEILLLFLGCQGHNQNPVTAVPHPGSQEALSDEVVSELPKGRTVANTPALWGLYEFAYDPQSHEISAVPLRGPSFALNVVTFLQPPRGSVHDMMVMVLDDSQFYSTGRLDVRVILHHPFPGQVLYTGFDVAGVFLTEGSITAPYDTDITYANPALNPTLLNADGYTRWMNPSEFLTGDIFGYEEGFWGTARSSENSGFVAGATINPYKYFAHGLAPDQSLADWLRDTWSVDGRGIFPNGATCARDYELLFPIVGDKLVFHFNYAVLANWQEPMIRPISDPIADFPHDANARYPVHVIGTDRSQVYHTPGDAGGDLRFDIEVFDWDAINGSSNVPDEVSKFVVWSDEPLVPGNSVEIMSTEVEWNSGFTASVSVASVEIMGAVPERSGSMHVWVAVESADPSHYDQGLGAMVPDDPIATYLNIPVDVKNCPKAFVSQFESSKMGRNSHLDDVVINGEGFSEGDDLAIYLEDLGNEGNRNEGDRIYATDVRFINESTITGDFDLHNVPIGDYSAGCVNGCGIETTPDDHYDDNREVKIQIVPPTPWDIVISTGRNTENPAPIESLSMFWNEIDDVEYYRIYAKCFDVFGSLLSNSEVGETTENYYVMALSDLPVTDSGVVEVWITACGTRNSTEYESLPSRSVYLYFQGFELGMGSWSIRAEEAANLTLIRSSLNASYESNWGIRAYGLVPWYPDLWTLLATPPLPDVDEAENVRFELLHRHRGIYHTNGYQVGWCNELPENGEATVTDYHPITEVTYGHPYNDDECSALRSEFNLEPDEDANFQTNYAGYEGWYLSGFDASDIAQDGVANYLVLALAGNYFNELELAIDEVAVLIY